MLFNLLQMFESNITDSYFFASYLQAFFFFWDSHMQILWSRDQNQTSLPAVSVDLTTDHQGSPKHFI